MSSNKIGRELTPEELEGASAQCENEAQRELTTLHAEQATLRAELASIVRRLREVADRASRLRNLRGC